MGKEELVTILEDVVRLTVRETVTELKQSGLLLHQDKFVYRDISETLTDYYNQIKESKTPPEAVKMALQSIRSDKYRNIIKLYYYDKMTIEKIAEIYDCDPCTITRNKKRLCMIIHQNIR